MSVKDDGWIDVGMRRPDDNRRLLVTNNISARNALGQPSHVWIIDLLQEMSDAPGYYCGYSGDDFIQHITDWRYLDEALRGEATRSGELHDKLENLAVQAGVALPLIQRAERFLRTSAPHHREREWYKLIEQLLVTRINYEERSTSPREDK